MRRARSGLAPGAWLARACCSLLPRARWLGLLAVLLSFTSQNIVLETHRHASVAAVSTIVTPGAHAQPASDPAPDTPANCPVCRELAHLATYLPPAPMVLAAPVSVAAPIAMVATLAPSGRQRSHAWQSRAPPSAKA